MGPREPNLKLPRLVCMKNKPVKTNHRTSRAFSALFILVILAACGSVEMVPPPDPTRLPPDAPVQSGEATPGATAPRPYDPQPGDDSLQRGPVFLDESGVLLMESYPPQAAVRLVGNLPTPCHSLRVRMSPPDAENRIRLEAYSLVDAGVVCAEVLQPFEITIPLGITSGNYHVLVNETEIGTIELQ